jgi:hypothetical protein
MTDHADQKPIAIPAPNATESHRMLAERRVDDSTDRVRFQQEYTIEGFKTLTLINGGAIIALLTYAGSKNAAGVTHDFGPAFIGYAVGLALSVLAYLFAYYSQGDIANSDMQEAYRLLGLQNKAGATEQAKLEKRGALWGNLAAFLAILSLTSFVIGSWLAMRTLS